VVGWVRKGSAQLSSDIVYCEESDAGRYATGESTCVGGVRYVTVVTIWSDGSETQDVEADGTCEESTPPEAKSSSTLLSAGLGVGASVGVSVGITSLGNQNANLGVLQPNELYAQ
jgi:hypothetical protein